MIVALARQRVLRLGRESKALLPLILLAALSPGPAHADGPALAHLTLEGTTLTLTAERAVTDADLAAAIDGDMTLSFAQRHLGFPMPPFLTLSLQQDAGTWIVPDLTLHRTSAAPPTVFGPDGLRVVTSTGEGTDLQLSIEGDALMPGGRLVPVQLDLALRSP